MTDTHKQAAFEAERSRLWGVAYRILGRTAEVDDAIQEAWLRYERTESATIDSVAAWLTTVTARICLNLLRGTRTSGDLDDLVHEESPSNTEEEVLLAETVGEALAVVIDRLSPAERVSFVLHDIFGMPFEEVAAVLERTPDSARQLASRARRRLREPTPDAPDPSADHVVDAFFTASKSGDLVALLAILDDSVILKSDAAAASKGSPALVTGRTDVAEFFNGKAKAARRATIDHRPGLVWSMGGNPQVIFDFTLSNGTITSITLLGDPGAIAHLPLEFKRGGS